MKTKLAPLIFLTSLPILAMGDTQLITVKQGATACSTEALLEQLVDALSKNDQAARDKLLKNGCVILGHDVKAAIVDFKGAGILIETTDTPKIDIWVLAKDVAN
jgi:hypothetical protein